MDFDFEFQERLQLTTQGRLVPSLDFNSVSQVRPFSACQVEQMDLNVLQGRVNYTFCQYSFDDHAQIWALFAVFIYLQMTRLLLIIFSFTDFANLPIPSCRLLSVVEQLYCKHLPLSFHRLAKYI